MININYQSYGNKGFQLRLRLYQDGETRFVSVTKLLKGSILKKHWNQRKQQFIPSCPFSAENNAILVQFRQKYDQMAINWNGSVYGLLCAVNNPVAESGVLTVKDFIQKVIGDLYQRKHPDGTTKGTFEEYVKIEKRLQEFCKFKKIKYDTMPLTELTPSFVNAVLDWRINQCDGKGLVYVSKILHALIMRAAKAELLDGDAYKKCKWVNKLKSSSQKYNTLSEEQIKRFSEMDFDSIIPSTRNQLFRDFCLFILYTGQSPCDAISLRYSDIQVIGGISHFVFKRRKIADKQAVPCSVPINDELDKIMLRWRKFSKDGYIFPIRNKEKLRNQGTENGDIKHFIGKINAWLKKVGKALDCKFQLHTYTFRHTAITRYISKGVPVIYVANMMGTSVDNCEKIYYNNQGDIASRNKVLAAMSI